MADAQEVSSPSRSGFDVKVRDVVADDVISATAKVALNRDADIVRGVVDNLLQDCDAIHDVMESMLHAVCSTFDDDIKHCVVSSILDEHKATTFLNSNNLTTLLTSQNLNTSNFVTLYVLQAIEKQFTTRMRAKVKRDN